MEQQQEALLLQFKGKSIFQTLEVGNKLKNYQILKVLGCPLLQTGNQKLTDVFELVDILVTAFSMKQKKSNLLPH